MQNKLGDYQWELLLKRISKGECTPFLGAGACFGTLPLGRTIAEQWAKNHDYPLDDAHDLARVSQYLALKYGESLYPKEKIIEEYFDGVNTPDFTSPDEPHALLAELPLPIYMTTNYDDFMIRALADRKKNVQKELCRWHESIQELPSPFDNGFIPTPENPIVYHLHGHKDSANSLVLTEDDYLDFLVNISSNDQPNNRVIPPAIRAAMTRTSLLFIGYSLADWDFRVIFRGLLKTIGTNQQRVSITVQLAPGSKTSSQEEVQGYLDRYFEKDKMTVYWGTAREFTSELRSRWETFSKPV
jgi:SIR2-like protein